MSYQDNDYEELIERADHFMGKNMFHDAWKCISAIPEDIKMTEFSDDCSFFAAIALGSAHFDQFIRYYKVYFNSIEKADNSFEDDLADLFFTMTTTHDSKIFPYVIQIINIVTARFRTSEILTLCAGVYNMIDLPEDSLALLDEALDKDPFNSKAWHEKAFSYHFIGDTDKELECCNYFLALVPDCDDYCIIVPIANSFNAAQRYDEAIAMLKRVLDNKILAPEHIAAVHCLIAESYSALSDNKNELFHRQKALDLYPEEVSYWSMLAQYYITSEMRPYKAEKIMDKAMERYPHDPVMHYMFAAVECQIAIEFSKKSRLDSAARHIESAIKEIKNDHLFLLLAARIYLLKKEYTSALKYSRRAYKLDPNDKSAILYLVLSNFGCGRLTEFRKLYRIYAKINPTAREDILVILPDAADTIDNIR